jgi:class 3 adenylate cyclase
MLGYVYGNNTTQTTTTMIFNNLEATQMQAKSNMYTTLFITFVLVIGTYFFSSDVNKLIIGPIERLVDLVRKISANPLGVEYKMLGAKEGFLEGMETTILLTTINRIGGLMQVGFGEAGASMIAKNLTDASGGRLNFMVGGTMIKSIFGFCDVRQFTDTTECLQEEVMLFVNRIAYILHDIVSQCSGSANKNIGDAFLLAWKLDEKMLPDAVTRLADQALLAFCKTLIEISRHQKYICDFSPNATDRLAKRFPNYLVRLGAGLHVGWAIEGAIGSNRKIDASYLSPHVNFTEYLESCTKEYGVALLMSEPFRDLLSPQAKKFVRQVDRVRRSKAEHAVGLFIYDMDMDINWNDEIRRAKRNAMAQIVDRGTRVRPERNRRASFNTNTNPVTGRHRSEDGRTIRERLASSGAVERFNIRRSSDHAPVASGGVNSDDEEDEESGSRSNKNKWFPWFQSSNSSSNNINIRDESDHRSVGGAMTSRFRESAGVSGRQRMRNPTSSHEAMARDRIGSIANNGQRASVFMADMGYDVEVGAGESSRYESRFDIQERGPKIRIHPYSPEVWESDADLIEVRHLISDSFRQQWDKGIQAYIKGDWEKARDIFHETVKLPGGREDGPSKFLINLIDEYGGTKPPNWQEYRMEG